MAGLVVKGTEQPNPKGGRKVTHPLPGDLGLNRVAFSTDLGIQPVRAYALRPLPGRRRDAWKIEDFEVLELEAVPGGVAQKDMQADQNVYHDGLVMNVTPRGDAIFAIPLGSTSVGFTHMGNEQADGYEDVTVLVYKSPAA